MKKKLATIHLTDFILSHIPEDKFPALIKYGLFDTKGEIDAYNAGHFHNNLFASTYKKFPFLPVLVHHDPSKDSDHDHGAWTEQVVYKNGDKFIAFDIDFFGQGECEEDPIGYEVKPKVVTITTYTKC